MNNKNDDGKQCTCCGRVLSISSFYKNKQSSDGHTSRCKECIKKYYQEDDNKNRRKAYQKQYYENNKEKIKEHIKQYDHIHIESTRERHRIKKNNHRVDYGYITTEQWNECLLFFNNLCAYSGEEFNLLSPPDRLSMEHIVPVECGGCGFPWNIIPVKLSYNSVKGTQDMYEWYAKQEMFSVIRLLKIEEWRKYAYNKWGYLKQGII